MLELIAIANADYYEVPFDFIKTEEYNNRVTFLMYFYILNETTNTVYVYTQRDIEENFIAKGIYVKGIKRRRNHMAGYNENITFTDSLTLLAKIQTKINQLSLPVHINGDNLISMDLSRYSTTRNISTADTISILNTIYNAPIGRNFLSVMSDKDTEEGTIGAYRIAQEIAKRIDKSDESYQNISRLLHLDKQSLNLDENCSTYIYTRAIQEVLPKEFVDFVKSNDWIQYSTENDEMPTLSFHARLRAIDRFALDGVSDIKELYTEESKNKLKSLMQTVYTTNPMEISSNGSEKRLIADFNHNGKEIEVVFSQNGKMVTIVPRRKTA